MCLPEKLLDIFPRALTIAGFDPSGGAGVLADVRIFAAFGLQAAAAITSITFQNEARVFGAVHQTGEAVRAQVMPLLADATFACAKTGMLPTREVVKEVARLFRETALPSPVVDPVIMSSSGQRLMEEAAFDVLISELLPLARLITPNISEAETLAGTKITSEADMRRAAGKIRRLGARAVLIKGGHLPGAQASGLQSPGKEEAGKLTEGGSPTVREGSESKRLESGSAFSEQAIDVLDDQGTVTVFRDQRVMGSELHGSGCILSAAIAAGLGKGLTLEAAVCGAKKFVLEAIRNS